MSETPNSSSAPAPPAGPPFSDSNAAFVEALYEQYLLDPSQLDASWRGYFDTLTAGQSAERAHGPVIAAVAARTQAGAIAP
ncbi:MAG TPA: hypothetical protein VGP20_02890, partial [Steroidobacteraceae bacterium]|nr:hypothetical protein [Steroidobacteraceae bacterium]